jgi:hypothetical protein
MPCCADAKLSQKCAIVNSENDPQNEDASSGGLPESVATAEHAAVARERVIT